MSRFFSKNVREIGSQVPDFLHVWSHILGGIKSLFEGFDPAKVVYDSPVKTPKDIKDAIDLGLHMNLDNELEVTKDNVAL